MRKPLRNLLLTLIAIPVSFSMFAQNYLGVHSSNYAGVMGLDAQPASFVDGRFIVDVNLFSANVAGWQNMKYFDTKVMPKWWKKSFTTDTMWMKPDSTLADRSIFDLYDYNKPGTRPRGAYMSTQLDILNFAFHINPKIAIGFSFKNRMVANIDNIDPKLSKLATEGFDFPSLWKLKLDDQFATVNMMAWNEYGLNYGQVVMDKGEHFLKVGGRVKLLQGIASAYSHSDHINYEFLNKDTMTTLQGNFSYGYSNNMDDMKNFNASTLFKSSSKLGFGLDLGVVYEWRPKWKDFKYEMDGVQDIWMRNENKYKIRAGVSIIDIGGMKFTKGGLSRDFSVNTTTLDMRVFKDVNSFASMDSVIDSLITHDSGWNESQGKGGTYYMNTPTALNFQLDYQIWKWFYINATGNINIIGKKNPSRVRTPNQFSITPSFDYAWFGLHIPVSVNNYSGWKVGMAARLGPITIGFVDFNSLFAVGKVKGTEFYMGLRVPVLYSKPKDRDEDKVSDKKDECIDVPGIWAFKGCPDKDGDGIPDKDDLCPDDAGLAQFKGCPDRDGDSIPDKDDACPDLAGVKEHRGCPDTDGDGIIDPKDDCPTEAGLAAFNGCPDKDGDGLPDKDDACPDAAGPIANQGCPDTDGDGIFDFVDNCPEVYGPVENNGCPWPDTDGDGLIDKDDECPYLAGPLANKGCPYQDTDGDGVLDKEDECPTVKGPKENKGCPEIEKEAQEILNTAFENLEFNTGNAVIKEVSFASLNELAALLVKKSDWKLQISGHTDNVGNPQANLVLSKKRAEAVKEYLSNHGVEAARLFTLFFGQTQPIADNSTPEGRQKNRRVEMTVIFK
jgi:outer membrane protein OmpA-like peptidoglycan-associated protein